MAQLSGPAGDCCPTQTAHEAAGAGPIDPCEVGRPYLQAVTDPAAGAALAGRLATREAVFARFVHRRAFVVGSARLAPACVVAPLACVGPQADLGVHVLLGLYAWVGHDSRVGACAVLSPCATMNGHVTFEEQVFLGA